MKAISCPQCGSLIKNVLLHQPIVECDYCGAKVITDEQFAAPEPFDAELAKFRVPARVVVPRTPMQPIFIVFAGIAIFIFAMFLISFLPAKSRSAVQAAPEVYKPIPFPPLAPIADKSDDGAALKFGGKGTSAGLFDGACAIAVDKKGNIYVADETRRVQRFDQNGKFTNVWLVKGEKNDTIDKLAADASGGVYVLIGGEIVVFKGETGEQRYVLSDSRRHYIDDFVLTDDGGMTYVAESGGCEEFVQTKGKVIVNRFAGIHSRAADARILPAGIKIAVGGVGDIFSVYAISSLEGTFEYNEEDLMTFRFAPNGKFVNKFAAGLMPEAIVTDNQSRVYVLTLDEIVVFSNTGGEIARLKVAGMPDAFAVDAQNNLYVVSGDVVRKLKPAVF